MICPRCEELIPVQGASESVASSVADNPRGPRITNRSVAGIVLAVMVGAGALALGYALKTQSFRRAQDSKGAVPPEFDPVATATPPHEWPGLGYLPTECQAIAGIRIADALDSAAGRAMLKSFGISADVAHQNRVLGLSPREVDHFLIGANFRALPPRFIAVAHDFQRIELDRMRKGMASTREIQHAGKILVAGRLWTNGLEGFAWNADRHMVVGTILAEDFDKIPSDPRFVGQSIAGVPIRHFDANSLAWFAMTLDANNATLELLTSFLALPPAEQEAWQKLESLSAGISAVGDQLTLTIHIRGRDSGSSVAIAKSIAQLLTKAGITNAQSADGEWQRLKATLDADKLTKLIAEFGVR